MTSLADYVKAQTDELKRYRAILKMFPDATIDLKLGEPCWDDSGDDSGDDSEDDDGEEQHVRLLICSRSAGPKVTLMHVDYPNHFDGFRVEYPCRNVWFWVTTPWGNVFTDPPSFTLDYHESWEDKLKASGISQVYIKQIDSILSEINQRREDGREFNESIKIELNDAEGLLGKEPPDVAGAVSCLERAALELSQARLYQHDMFLDVADDIWNRSPSRGLAKRLVLAVDMIPMDLNDGRVGHRRGHLSNILHRYIH